jgi:glutamine synthetase
MTTPADVLKMLKEKEVKFVDLRFTDTRGKEQHVSVPSKQFTMDKFEAGHAFDGSSIAGWKGIQASDMLLMPDSGAAYIDPFTDETTLNITCDVVEPSDGKGYERDPRSLAKRAEAYLKSTGLGDTAYFGPEPEFFIFDAVEWSVDMSGSYCKIFSSEAAWSGAEKFEGGNMGHRPTVKGGYFPVPPVDSLQDIRSGDLPRARADGRRSRSASPRSGQRGPMRNRHEVRVAGEARRLVAGAEIRRAQHCARVRQDRDVHAEADRRRQRLGHALPPIGVEERQEPVRRRRLRGAVDFALYYIGGVIKHAKALNAITNPGTNSYKRLVPGFEAPINLAYSARNRSAAIRIPYVPNPKGRRIEVRFPDPTANAYLAFSAMLMAGLDGVQNKIHPGDPMDKNLYDLEPEEAAKVPHPCASLDEALDHLDKDRAFLTRGGVFTDDMIDGYIGLKMEEVTRFRMTTHPVEYDMYYSL